MRTRTQPIISQPVFFFFSYSLIIYNVLYAILYCFRSVKGVLHPKLVFGLFLHFSQKLQHIGNK